MFPHFRNPPHIHGLLQIPVPPKAWWEQQWEQFQRGEPESHGVPGFCIAWVALKNHVMPSLNIINVLLRFSILSKYIYYNFKFRPLLFVSTMQWSLCHSTRSFFGQTWSADRAESPCPDGKTFVEGGLGGLTNPCIKMYQIPRVQG